MNNDPPSAWTQASANRAARVVGRLDYYAADPSIGAEHPFYMDGSVLFSCKVMDWNPWIDRNHFAEVLKSDHVVQWDEDARASDEPPGQWARDCFGESLSNCPSALTATLDALGLKPEDYA